MNIEIKPLDYKQHATNIVAIENAHQPGSVAEQDTIAWYENYFAQGHRPQDFYSAVAVNAAGDVIGYNEVRHSAWHEAGTYGLRVLVHPAQRRQGVGAALYADALRFAHGNAVTVLRTNVADDSETDMTFARGRGFEPKAHLFPSTLDLKMLDEEALVEALDSRRQLEAQGWRFTSMAGLGDTIEARRKLHRLNATTANDIPGATGNYIPPFEDFNREVCEQPWYRPEGQRVVIHDNTGEFAAMSAVTVNADGHAYNLHTGVAREWRGRKLAQAVKCDAIQYAIGQGATCIDTDNDSRNAPMLAINVKLGYARRAGKFQCEKIMSGESTRS